MTAQSVFILTGAGISAESGLGVFRDQNGLWTQFNLEDLATPEGFARNPQRVLDFYNARRAGLAQAKPNPAHHALARLQSRFAEAGRSVAICTQNIDDLHEQAGARDVLHMHGELMRALCMRCRASSPWVEDLALDSRCPACDTIGGLRPDVVWFGETPYALEEISLALEEADLFVSIGTSGAVYPAAGFAAVARAAGTPTLEINLAPSDTASLFDTARYGPASQAVPAWVEEMLGGV
jgi:NAD-dependent deacetylase